MIGTPCGAIIQTTNESRGFAKVAAALGAVGPFSVLTPLVRKCSQNFAEALVLPELATK